MLTMQKKFCFTTKQWSVINLWEASLFADDWLSCFSESVEAPSPQDERLEEQESEPHSSDYEMHDYFEGNKPPGSMFCILFAYIMNE